MAENIRVAVRIRPENAAEVRGAHGIVVKPLDDEGLVFDPDESDGTQKSGPNCYRRKARDVHFHFDRVFDEQSSQQDVFDGTAKNILDGVFSGFNCSVLAYGATGAGKTHTMLGSSECPGLIFLIMMELYRRMDEMSEEKVCDITISYLEVYNETIRDLLKPSKALAVREDPQKGVVINQLSAHKPSDAHDLLRMLSTGNGNRTQHPTDANATSSRSHAVFQVLLKQKPRTAGLSAEVRSAKLLLVDLAGSERATVSKNRGDRQREGANINRSLLALGNCINALAEGNSKAHIPYRDSKLTRILKDSLGGNCRTAFIANVSPSSISYEDTLNTLRYAERAKKIKVKLSENRTRIDFHATRYRGIVIELQKEIADLKKRLKTSKEADPSEKLNTTAAFELLQKVQQETREIINEKLALRQRLRDIQASQRDVITLSLRTSRLKARVQCLMPDDKRILGKLDTKLSMLVQRQEELDDQYQSLQGKLKENASRWSASYSNALASMTVLANKVQWLRPSIQQVLDARRLEVHEVEHGRELKHLRQFANSQKLDAENTETLVQQSLRLIQVMHRRLTACGGLNDDVDQYYSSLIRTVQGAKSLAWADGQAPSAATAPRHGLNRSFVESSPYERLRHHRQMLAAALQSPPHLPDELSPVGNNNTNNVGSVNNTMVASSASHSHIQPVVADGSVMATANGNGVVAQSGSGTSLNSQAMGMPTRSIMATPGTSLFRSPGETPPIRPTQQPSQPSSPHASAKGTSSAAARSVPASPISIPSNANPDHAYSPSCSTLGAYSASAAGMTAVSMHGRHTVAANAQTPMQPLYQRNNPTGASPPHHAPTMSMITSTPGVILAGHGAMQRMVPPTELAFTPVVSRPSAVSLSDSSAFSRPQQPVAIPVSSGVAPSPASSAAVASPVDNGAPQPGYMVSRPSSLTKRRTASSSFFSEPPRHQDAIAASGSPTREAADPVNHAVSQARPIETVAEGTDVVGDVTDDVTNSVTRMQEQAADIPLPPSPDTFIMQSPGTKANQRDVDLECTVTLSGSPTGYATVRANSGDRPLSQLGQSLDNPLVLPPPPPGLKGTRQRVRGIMDEVDRPRNSLETDGNAVANTTFTAEPADAPTTATFVMEQGTKVAVTAASGSGNGKAGAKSGSSSSSVPSSKAALKSSQGNRSTSSAAGSMSLSASLSTKLSTKSARPSTYSAAGRKQHFASLTASARSKQIPVRGRLDENADPHLGVPKRPGAKNTTVQLEAFKAKLNQKSNGSGSRLTRATTR